MTVFEEKRGRHVLKAEHDGSRYTGIVDCEGTAEQMLTDDDLDRLKRRLRQFAPPEPVVYYGLNGAVRRFLSIFPGGFTDPAYRRLERHHKVAASERLALTLTLKGARTATPAQAAELAGVFDTGILDESEMGLISAILAGPTGADFVRGAARFADGRYSEGLRAMEAASRPHGRATWTMVTYLPWLWLPEEHLLIKSAATLDFASRVGHDFSAEYEPSLIPDVYRSAKNLAEFTQDAIGHLNVADLIDVQGFVWVVGSYSADEHVAR